MKNLIRYTAISLLASIALTSCVSITKRHTNKGYYITTTRHKPAVFSPNDQAILHTENKRSGNIEQSQTAIIRENKTAEIKSTEQQQAPSSEIVNLDQQASLSTQSNTEKSSASSPKQTITKQSNTLKELVKHPQQMQSKIKKMTANKPISDDLSLVWVIVIILLVLWALGMIAGGLGLGGLIHILLVIALILFILWLLRII